ncbi:MAG TPA: hypothetical protein VK689_18195, partial [Armatimonadota bacterium]|nr:hypothetical protein [Armatimonadota bacterium]
MDRASTPRTRRPRSRPAAALPGPEPEPAAAPAPPAQSRLRTDLLAIGLFLLAVLLALGLYRPGSVGWAGGFLVHFFRFWSGWVVHVLPILLVATAVALALDYRRATNLQAVLGVLGFLVLLFGSMHLAITDYDRVFDTSGARFA